jgi:transketolase
MTVNMRDAFFNGIYECVKKDKNVFVITADHGAFGLSKIEKEFPDQFLNVGIAEQNMISLAAGLAKCGKIVYVYSINNFITLRSLEHVNIDLCAMNLHVNLVGVGAGFTYATDGPTHQGMQDMQSMMVLPNLSVFNVTDHINSHELALLGHSQPGPKYFRIEKGNLPQIYNEKNTFNDGFFQIEDSNDTVIVSTGYMIQTCLYLKDFISNLGIIDLYRVKPINEKKLVEKLKNVKNIIVLEECTTSGGICEKIGFILAKNKIFCNFLPISVEDKHCHFYGTRDMLHKEYNIDKESVLSLVKNFLEN